MATVQQVYVLDVIKKSYKTHKEIGFNMTILQEAILSEAIEILKRFTKDVEVWKAQTKIIRRVLREIKPQATLLDAANEMAKKVKESTIIPEELLKSRFTI